jgi:hypothetical protein
VNRRELLRAGLAGAAALGCRSLSAQAPLRQVRRTVDSIAHDPGLPPQVFRTTAPRDASVAALLDCGSLPRSQQSYQFYVWDNLGTRESMACVSWTINAVLSQSPIIYRPRRIEAHNGARLLAWNLRDLCPRETDLDRLFGVLQELAAFEYYFHQVSAFQRQEKTTWRRVPWYRASDRHWYNYVAETTVEKRKFEFAIHADAGSLSLLSDLAYGTQLPIVRADWFMATAWTAINSIDGVHGRYYQLSGIDQKKQRGVTQFDSLLKQIKADPKLDDEIRQKSVQLSDVTGLWRTAEIQPTLGLRLTDGQGMARITHDIKDSNEDEESDGLLSLDDVKDDAREIIFTLPNGLDGFYLTDGDGNQLEEADGHVASWKASPWPRAPLFSGMACIQCHGGNGGVQQLVNQILRNDRNGFSPVFDLTKKGGRVRNVKTQEILRAQFLADLEPALQTRRVQYASKLDEATLGVFAPKPGEKDAIVAKASAALNGFYQGYFARLTAQQILAELGYLCPPKLASAVLRRMLPSLEDDDAHLRTAMNGDPILRANFQKVYAEAALRDAFRRKP